MKTKLCDIPVDEYTTPCPQVLTKGTELLAAMELMQKEGIRHLPIVEGNRAIGILSERDVKVISNLEWAKKLNVEDIMTESPYTVTPDTSLEKVTYEMSANKYGSAIVADDDGSIQGIFTTTDALNALIEIIRGTI